MKIRSAIAVVLALAPAAWSGDLAVDGACAGPPRVTAPAAFDQATTELKWDEDTFRSSAAWYTGAGAWVGNDFSTATLKTSHVKILKFRMYSRGDWPNNVWDGFRVGLFDFAGNVPGSRLWPTAGGGYFFRPSGPSGHAWVECNVNWICPAVKFVAAQEQYYDWPNCDPWSVDANDTFREHSWNYYAGVWSPLNRALIEIGPFYNLKLRVTVETGHTIPAVEPASLGRVKALYN